MTKSVSWSAQPNNLPARDPLLQTKLYIPQRRLNCVPRPRLTEKLAQGLTRPLTLISAPAGFGKTTLIGEWHALAANQYYALTWLSLDDDDNDPARFWAYVIAALQAQWPTVGVDALDMLHAGWPQSSLPKVFLTSLLNDLAALTVTGVLVLDDYHVIESKLIHDSFVYWVDHLPPQLHVIIASRIDPPLPLARLRARNQLVEIRAADLRFTPNEAASFLNQVTGLGLTPEDVTSLEARTEGWIAGLQLAAIALQTRVNRSGTLPAPSSAPGHSDISNFIAAFTGSNRYVLDYLVEEVLRRQSESLQTFLLQTSILEQLCGSLCEAVTGRSDSQAILEQLEQSNLFTTPLDEERRWYRYHHLFVEFLHSRLAHTQPDRIPELHRRAAEWHERNGLIDDAVAHALAAQEWEHAAHLVERSSQALLMRGEMHTLRNWLQALPDNLVRSQPQLSILRAWLCVWSLDIQIAEDYLRDAEQTIATGHVMDAQARVNLETEIKAIRSVVYVFRGDMPRAAELARQALEYSTGDNWFLRSAIALDTSLSSAMDGDAQAANQALAESIQFSQQAHNVTFAVIAMSQLAEQYIAQGHLHQAAALYQQAIQLAEQHAPPSPVTSLAYSGMAEVLREWNRLEEATPYLNKSIEFGLQWNEAMSLDGYISLARVKQAQGDVEAALAATRKVSELGHRFDFFSLGVELFPAYLVRPWITQGNLDAVSRWAQTCELADRKQQIQVSSPYLLREYIQLALAHAQLALNHSGKALPLIERLASESGARGRQGIVIEATMLKALALQAMDDTVQALAALEQAFSWAEPEGYMRLFLDKGEPMKLLIADCRLKIEKQVGGESKKLMVYIDKLLAAFPEAGSVSKLEISNLQSKIIGPLSDRELEVLRMIAAGLSNQEIADRLVVALSTIKSHINNIYNKLGVNSRVQAIERARDLNLL